MRVNSFSALALLSSLAASSVAQADIVTVTYEGVISDINDNGRNLFGGGSLTGDNVTVTYVFNTKKGAFSLSANAESYTGGSLFGNTSPARSATITINGDSVKIGGAEYGSLAETSDASSSYQYAEADESAKRYVYSFVNAAPGALPASLTSAYSYDVQASDNAFGYFQIGATSASFAPTSVFATATPEPATWAMLLLGFAGLGFVGARARRAAA